MIESHLVAGNQPLKPNLSELTYGQSVTDACIGWAETARVIVYAPHSIRANSADADLLAFSQSVRS